MIKIELTKGKYALIDDKDFELVSNYSWYYCDGYAMSGKYIGNYKTKTILMHRLINDTPDGFDTDHINRDKLDNRKINLRSVTRSHNAININLKKNNKSGFTGVVWDKQMKKWRAQIMLDRKQNFLGLFNILKDAVSVRKEFERGIFA